ncbi:MAG: FG-GAP-like repeat-containing protein, partial [Acidobacteriota bacterium]
LVDIDGDGDLDALTTTAGLPLANQLWLGDGAGQFTPSSLSFGNTRTEASAVGDLDGDTDLDFLAVSATGAHRTWMNQTESGAIFQDDFESGALTAWDSIVP